MLVLTNTYINIEVLTRVTKEFYLMKISPKPTLIINHAKVQSANAI